MGAAEKTVYGVPESKYIEIIKAVYHDPELFVEVAYDWTGLDPRGPTDQQRRVLRALKDGKTRLAIRSGHGTGKSTLMAWIQHWFLLTRRGAVIPCTAPSAHQLRDVLWAESARWLERLLPPFKGQLEWTTDRVRHVEAPESWFAVARTSRRENPDALAGFHARHIMYLVDEAPGVPEEIFETAEGALSTPGAFVIMAGNPTRLDGTFYQAFHKDRDHWTNFHFDSRFSPLVDPAYPERMAAKYGEDSDVYRVRVLGEFPQQEADSLIPLSWVEAAAARERVLQRDQPALIGVDVARYGDNKTVYLVRQGRNVLHIVKRPKVDTMEAAYQVAALTDDWEGANPRIFVDSIGVGAGVADRLREMGYDVVDVNVSERAAMGEKFMNLRSELWWKVREWFENANPWIPMDDELIAQLSTVKFRVTPAGKIRIESKEEMRSRGVESPDVADALMLTFMADVVGTNVARSKMRSLARQVRYRPFDPELGF